MKLFLFVGVTANMKNNYPTGVRFRSVVAAWHESSLDFETSNAVERIVCTEVDYYPVDTQSTRAAAMAKALIKQLYPTVNQFDIYNTVSRRNPRMKSWDTSRDFVAGANAMRRIPSLPLDRLTIRRNIATPTPSAGTNSTNFRLKIPDHIPHGKITLTLSEKPALFPGNLRVNDGVVHEVHHRG